MKTAKVILEKHRQSGRIDWIYCDDAIKAMEEYAEQQAILGKIKLLERLTTHFTFSDKLSKDVLNSYIKELKQELK